MAKEKTKAKAEGSEEGKEKKIVSSNAILDSFLKGNKADHYNFEKETTYKVSSGSFILDRCLNGGLNPGLHRFCGINEGGKTSCALSFMHNFLKMKKAKGFYIKAEGRLSEGMRERSGVKFVFTAEEWVEGTCFVLETNIYEVAVDAMRQLVTKNDEGNLYYFILDSVDGLITKGDMEKDFEDSNKVAGGAVIASNFMKRLSIALTKRGHMAVFISQVRANITLTYSGEPVRQTSATGGNALLHFANWILEFQPRFKDDIILKNPDLKLSPENPPVGHWAKAFIKKSPDEKSNQIVPYPIRYGRTNGSSVWIEKELLDMVFIWEFLVRNGSWISATEEFQEMLEKAEIAPIPKIQGMESLFKYFEENKNLCDYLVEYFNSIGT